MSTPIRAPSPPFALAGFGIAVALVAVVGASFGGSAVETYLALRLPPWAPPPWLFGPMWMVLFVLLALSGWLYWRAGGTRTGVALYGVGLILNGAWNPLFFGAELAFIAFLDIVALGVVVLVTMWLFSGRSRVAALFQIPYLAWIVYMATLNFAVVVLN